MDSAMSYPWIGKVAQLLRVRAGLCILASRSPFDLTGRTPLIFWRPQNFFSRFSLFSPVSNNCSASEWHFRPIGPMKFSKSWNVMNLAAHLGRRESPTHGDREAEGSVPVVCLYRRRASTLGEWGHA